MKSLNVTVASRVVFDWRQYFQSGVTTFSLSLCRHTESVEVLVQFFFKSPPTTSVEVSVTLTIN